MDARPLAPGPVLHRDATRRQRRQDREADGSRGAFDGEMRALGFRSRTETEVDATVPPHRVAALLGMPTGRAVVFRRRLMLADNDPVQLATSWLAPDITTAAPAVRRADPGPGGIYSRFADAGYPVAVFTEEIVVREPHNDEATQLRLDAAHRVYEVTRTATGEAGQVLEINIIVLPTHQWTLSYTWPAED